VAVMLGTAVERGSNAAITTPALLDLFLSWLPKLPAPEIPDGSNEDEEPHYPDPTPEQAALLEALPYVAQSLVSHLARMPEERHRLATDAALIERLDVLGGYSHGATWVREALVRTSGSIVVLHPPSGIGFKVRYQNIGACFHLFTLLQAAIGERIPGGRQPDLAIVAAAKGRGGDRLQDEAWWHYGDPRSRTADIRFSIWGEGLASSIPVIEGSQVILLWPSVLESRSWTSGFFGPHLEALPVDLVIEEQLSRERCAAWFRTLGVQSGAARRKSWWPW
jgi:hypothetical protein